MQCSATAHATVRPGRKTGKGVCVCGGGGGGGGVKGEKERRRYSLLRFHNIAAKELQALSTLAPALGAIPAVP